MNSQQEEELAQYILKEGDLLQKYLSVIQLQNRFIEKELQQYEMSHRLSPSVEELQISQENLLENNFKLQQNEKVNNQKDKIQENQQHYHATQLKEQQLMNDNQQLDYVSKEVGQYFSSLQDGSAIQTCKVNLPQIDQSLFKFNSDLSQLFSTLSFNKNLENNISCFKPNESQKPMLLQQNFVIDLSLFKFKSDKSQLFPSFQLKNNEQNQQIIHQQIAGEINENEKLAPPQQNILQDSSLFKFKSDKSLLFPTLKFKNNEQVTNTYIEILDPQNQNLQIINQQSNSKFNQSLFQFKSDKSLLFPSLQLKDKGINVQSVQKDQTFGIHKLQSENNKHFAIPFSYLDLCLLKEKETQDITYFFSTFSLKKDQQNANYREFRNKDDRNSQITNQYTSLQNSESRQQVSHHNAKLKFKSQTSKISSQQQKTQKQNY